MTVDVNGKQAIRYVLCMLMKCVTETLTLLYLESTLRADPFW